MQVRRHRLHRRPPGGDIIRQRDLGRGPAGGIGRQAQEGGGILKIAADGIIAAATALLRAPVAQGAVLPVGGIGRDIRVINAPVKLRKGRRLLVLDGKDRLIHQAQRYGRVRRRCPALLFGDKHRDLRGIPRGIFLLIHRYLDIKLAVFGAEGIVLLGDGVDIPPIEIGAHEGKVRDHALIKRQAQAGRAFRRIALHPRLRGRPEQPPAGDIDAVILQPEAQGGVFIESSGRLIVLRVGDIRAHEGVAVQAGVIIVRSHKAQSGALLDQPPLAVRGGQKQVVAHLRLLFGEAGDLAPPALGLHRIGVHNVIPVVIAILGDIALVDEIIIAAGRRLFKIGPVDFDREGGVYRRAEIVFLLIQVALLPNAGDIDRMGENGEPARIPLPA